MMEENMLSVNCYWPYGNIVWINPVYTWYYYLNPLLVKVIGAEKAKKYHQVPISFCNLEHLPMSTTTNNNESDKNDIINIYNDSEIDVSEQSHHSERSVNEENKENIEKEVDHQSSHYGKNKILIFLWAHLILYVNNLDNECSQQEYCNLN